jgi:hypothetical protein
VGRAATSDPDEEGREQLGWQLAGQLGAGCAWAEKKREHPKFLKKFL